jgi:hypothetical protein
MNLSTLNQKIAINPIKIDYKEFWQLHRGVEQLPFFKASQQANS